jgi:benzoyl-CoA reductase/2-hydroxyglutaryl-CoA dehydratase subunit BcrC/BadD/HgdB
MSLIKCSCGECKLTTFDDYPMLSLFCACKDCRQAIKWGELRGGKAAQKLPKLIYVRSDIL